MLCDVTCRHAVSAVSGGRCVSGKSVQCYGGNCTFKGGRPLCQQSQKDAGEYIAGTSG